MRTIVLYHSIDLDGWMSAAIVKKWFIEETPNLVINNLDSNELAVDHNKVYDDLINNKTPKFAPIEYLYMKGWNYGDSIPNLDAYDEVIMCDISFPKDEMFKLFERLGVNFTWIDHHKSAILDNGQLDEHHLKDISTLYNGLRRTDFAACELTWLYFFPNYTMPEIVHLLGRYDCFSYKGTSEEQQVLEFQYGARAIISNYKEAYEALIKTINHAEETIKLLDENILFNTKMLGKGIYAYLCTEAKQTYANWHTINLNYHMPFETGIDKESAELTTLDGFNFLAINKERFNPINFGIDYHKDGYDGVVSYHFDGKVWCFSFYNDNREVDCSLIAKQFGGGGHKGAAGCRVNNLMKVLG